MGKTLPGSAFLDTRQRPLSPRQALAPTSAQGSGNSVHQLGEGFGWGAGEIRRGKRGAAEEVDLPGLLPKPFQFLREEVKLFALRPAFLL